MSTTPYSEKVRHIHGCNIKIKNDRVTREQIRFTVVSKKLSETQVEYKVAYCSPKDVFVKKTGIEVARNSDKIYTVDIRVGDTFRDVNFAILADMVKNREDAPKAHNEYLEDIFNNITNL